MLVIASQATEQECSVHHRPSEHVSAINGKLAVVTNVVQYIKIGLFPRRLLDKLRITREHFSKGARARALPK